MQLQDDLDLNNAFEIIVSNQNFTGVTNEIACLIKMNLATRDSIEKILYKYQIRALTDLKEELLNLILAYINIILQDHELTQKELRNLKQLKLLFHIQEGDFLKYRYKEMKEILHQQLMPIYRNDNRIDDYESIFKVGLQELFTLGYDQFLKFANEEDKIALEKGADISDLDTVLSRSKLMKLESEIRHRISPRS